MSQTRRLAAILAADVAGYSRLIGADEGATLRGLKAIRVKQIDDDWHSQWQVRPSLAHRSASTTLLNSTSKPSPVVFDTPAAGAQYS
jgi:hypothetical protein